MNRRTGKIFLFLGNAGLLLALLSCKGSFVQKFIEDKKEQKEAPPIPAPPPVAPPVAPPAAPTVEVPAVPPASQAESLPTAVVPAPGQEVVEAQTIEEINGYVECLNRTMSRTRSSQQRYLAWVDANAGPNCKEPYITYGLYTLYADGVEKCQKAAKRGLEGPPALPVLEKSTGDLSAAYAQLVPLVQTAEDYYQQQDYKDDHCAKGRALHPQLMDAFGRYLAAAEILEKELDSRKAELEQKTLTRLEQQVGRRLEWQLRTFMRSARNLVNTLPKKELAQLSAALYLSAFDPLQASYDAMTAYAQANAAEAQATFWFSAFESSAKNFYTQAKFLKRDLAEGKKPDAAKVNSLVDNFNRLVGDSNNVGFK